MEPYAFERATAARLVEIAKAPERRRLDMRGGASRLTARPPGLFRFTMTADFVSGVAAATIKRMDGTTVGSSEVADPGSHFAFLESGDSGLCLQQAGTYYIIWPKQTTTVTVVTAERYNAGTWQNKTRSIRCWTEGDESAWTDIVTGSECT